MAKYQVYIDQNFLVIQECEDDGTTTVGLAVNEPAKNVSVSARVDGGTKKYFFTDKTTGRTFAGGIAVDDMFSDTSGTTYANEAAFIAFYRAQLGKSSPRAVGLEYIACLTQSGEKAPTAEVGKDDLGGELSYEGVGIYHYTKTGAFTDGKTWTYPNLTSAKDVSVNRISDDVVQIYSPSGDDVLYQYPIKILVFN